MLLFAFGCNSRCAKRSIAQYFFSRFNISRAGLSRGKQATEMLHIQSVFTITLFSPFLNSRGSCSVTPTAPGQAFSVSSYRKVSNHNNVVGATSRKKKQRRKNLITYKNFYVNFFRRAEGLFSRFQHFKLSLWAVCDHIPIDAFVKRRFIAKVARKRDEISQISLNICGWKKFSVVSC